MNNANPEKLLFIGDNGRTSCWRHSGSTICSSFMHSDVTRDLSGEPVAILTPEEAAEYGCTCESCEREELPPLPLPSVEYAA